MYIPDQSRRCAATCEKIGNKTDELCKTMEITQDTCKRQNEVLARCDLVLHSSNQVTLNGGTQPKPSEACRYHPQYRWKPRRASQYFCHSRWSPITKTISSLQAIACGSVPQQQKQVLV
jgi:hypothetical protein